MAKDVLADVSTAGGARQASGPSGPREVPALTILSHPRASRVGEQLLLEELLVGREVALSRNEPHFKRAGSALGAPLEDPFISRRPLRFKAVAPDRLRISVVPQGTEVAIGAPLHGELTISADQLAAGVPLELAGRIVLLLHLAVADETTEHAADTLGMVGRSAGLRLVCQNIARISDLHLPVLIRGETGSGKELVARAIAERGPRRRGPFLSVNLGAIPKDLAVAELFGTHKGAFTGATRDREGYFRAASGGTLFLDEVAEAPPEVQVMLLRVLETGEIFPLGGHTPIVTDVRLIAATDADLVARIGDGRFKAPLLHRLAGFEIYLPPLRERREDIGMLFFHFARQELEAIGEARRLSPPDPYATPWLPAPIMARLVHHDWPGNIRQLRNVTRQLVVGSRGQEQLRLDLRLEQELGRVPPLTLHGDPPVATPLGIPTAPARRKPSEVGAEELVSAMRAAQWDLKAAADLLGIPRSSIYDLIARTPQLRTAGELNAEEITRCFHDCAGDLDMMVGRLQVSKRALLRRVKELGLSAAD